MQVILLDRITNLGQLGEVVRVRDGYARNFLIPKGLAKRATQGAIAEFKIRREEIERVAEEKLKYAKKIGDAVEGKTIEIFQKAGLDGKLFGSVTGLDIASRLTTKDLAINKSQIQLPDGPIKTTGEHIVRIAPHSEVVVEVTVKDLPELAEQ